MVEAMKDKGFSLVELAIVLVIIGLITGGILTGQELIRASELNNVVSEYNKYMVATNTFKLKYNAYPGDLKNAQSYWGTNAGCAAGTAGTGTQTCNGNGDGLITASNPGSFQEQVYFWQHLANAGLISGSYTGVSANYYGCLTTNCPTGKMAASSWGAKSTGTITDADAVAGYAGWWFEVGNENIFIFGDANGGSGYNAYPIFTPAEALSIDGKVDDRNPGLGKWRTAFGPAAYSSCAVNASTGAALASGTRANATISGYPVSNSNKLCSFEIYWH